MPHRAPHPKLRHVQRVRRRLASGGYNAHDYYRRGNVRAKLPGKPHSPEYMAVYRACERQVSAAAKFVHPKLGSHTDPQNCRPIFFEGGSFCVGEDGCLLAGEL